MIRLYLIRHGQTPGNKLQRYIGTTDEPLSTEGKEFLEKLTYPMPEALYVSPLCRCVETAGILFPGKSFHIIEELSECDFGEFENKNYKELSGNRKIHLLRWGKEFNYSAINNFAAAHAKGEYLLFLNNDVKSINPDWLEEMLGVCQRPEVGGVGAKLIYPDNTIQHAGCVIGMGGIAGHMFVDMPADRTGYLHKASLLQDMSAVTAACLLMKKEVFEQAGGFTEELAVAFNDMDLCLKVRKNGYLIVYDPYAKLYHMESKTRGAEDSKEKVRRFQTEIEYMRCHWIDILKNGDPCYNKNLSLTKWNYSLKPIPGMETEAGQKKEKTGRKSCRKYQ